MNEKILRLVSEARQYAWENETHWSANAEREKLFEEKFAELLIKECVDICNHHPSKISSNNWFPDSVAPDIGNKLCTHFGVKQ
jgi:hypothetical protein